MAKKKDLWVSPTRHGGHALCQTKDWLHYVRRFRMPSNINFALGGGIHSAAEFAVKSRRENVSREQLKAIFAQKWAKEFSGPMYLKPKDNVDNIYAMGEQMVDKFCDQFLDRQFPFDPIDYIPVGHKQAVPACELSYNVPCVNPVTGETIDGVRLIGVIDAIGVHDKYGVGPVDWKTGARKYSETKIEKGIQLAHYAVAMRIMMQSNPGMFPLLDIIGKTKEDVAMYLLFKKTKGLEVEPYKHSFSDANINFFWDGLKDTIKSIRLGLRTYNEGPHCDHMCSYKPICDAIMNGEDEVKAYEDFLKRSKDFTKEKMNGAKAEWNKPNDE